MSSGLLVSLINFTPCPSLNKRFKDGVLVIIVGLPVDKNSGTLDGNKCRVSLFAGLKIKNKSALINIFSLIFSSTYP